MLKFTCKTNCTEIQKYFLKEIKRLMKKHDIKTVIGNCYDKNLIEKLLGLIAETNTGFIFDKQDLIGVEPYGYVSDFFEDMIKLVRNIKSKYPGVGIDGYFMMLDLGAVECILRQRVEAKENESRCICYDQIQCICCQKWADVKDAYELLYDEDVFWTGDELNTVLYPSVYSNDEYGPTFCICSKECKDNIDV